MGKIFKNGIFGVVLALALIGIIIFPGGAEGAPKKNGTWDIIVYLCGSTMETDYGAGTRVLNDISSGSYGENVRWIIEAGGARNWQTKRISPKRLTRLVDDTGGLRIVDRLPSADMGERQTLVDFFTFVKENYPADNYVVIFKNHGGGVFGACLDQKYNSMLTLDDITAGLDALESPVEMVGFDACLMANIETVGALYQRAHYLTASEESVVTATTETDSNKAVNVGCWPYREIGEAIAAKPNIDGSQLGDLICQKYYDKAKTVGASVDNLATMSVIDVGEYPRLRKAYGDYAAAAIQAAQHGTKEFFAEFSRAAGESENYGSHSDNAIWMVDIADMAKHTEDILPKVSENLEKAVDRAVVTQIKGMYRSDANGISAYYPYTHTLPEWKSYTNTEAVLDVYKYLYAYMFYGELLPGGDKYLKAENRDYTEHEFDVDVSQIVLDQFDLGYFDNRWVMVDKDNVMRLKAKDSEVLNVAYVKCVLTKPDKDGSILYGEDEHANIKWEEGIFADKFDGKWPALDGELLATKIYEHNDDYIVYTAPVTIDLTKTGQDINVIANLLFAYDVRSRKYILLGWLKNEADKELGTYAGYKLARRINTLPVGARVTPIYHRLTVEGLERKTSVVNFAGKTVTIKAKSAVTNKTLPDGWYQYGFGFVNPLGEEAYSNKMTFAVNVGRINPMGQHVGDPEPKLEDK